MPLMTENKNKPGIFSVVIRSLIYPKQLNKEKKIVTNALKVVAMFFFSLN
jgi:hypothetical protein